MMSGTPADVTVGGACAFQLPHSPGCAAYARSLLGSAMAELGLGHELIEDGELAISELATNAYQHAALGLDHPVVAPELWIWARTRPAPQLVVSVFDGDRSTLPRVAVAGVQDECGRGLGIVAAVSARWGAHLSRCRLGSRLVAGKATWFALSLPRLWPVARPMIAPSVAARELIGALASRGVDGSCHSVDEGTSVVRVGDLNVWVRPGGFCWRDGGGGYARHPLGDLQEVAERIVWIQESAAAPAWPLTARSASARRSM